MPTKKECAKISSPVERAKCEQYKGEYAKEQKNSNSRGKKSKTNNY